MDIFKIYDNVALTVALPVYNAKGIGILPMESLCHQQGVDFNWELLICEENHKNMLGKDFFALYADRLKDKGCVRMAYFNINSWIPLPQKWKLLGEKSSPSSKIYAATAADDYPPHERLMLTKKYMDQGYDWLDFKKAFFYSFKRKSMILYNAQQIKNIWFAFPMDFGRNIPFSKLTKYIDGFLLQSLINFRKGTIKKKHIDELYHGVCTDGYNNISNRDGFYIKKCFPFEPTSVTIDTIRIPEGVRSWIKSPERDEEIKKKRDDSNTTNAQPAGLPPENHGSVGEERPKEAHNRGQWLKGWNAGVAKKKPLPKPATKGKRWDIIGAANRLRPNK